MAAESLSNALPPAKRSKPDSPHDVDLAASSAVGPTSLQNTHTAVANGALVLPSSMGRVDVLSEFLTRAAPGSSAGEACSGILTSFMQRLQEESVKLQAALDLHSLPDVPAYCRQIPSYETAQRIAVHAHKLSYTTFAPETVLGQNLFRPPAPQEWDFRASALHSLAGDTAEDRKTAADPASAKDEEDDAGKGPKEEVLQDAQARIPLEESGTWQEDIKQQTAAQPPQPSTDFVDSAFDFILNPDLEEAVEDYSSSEEESE